MEEYVRQFHGMKNICFGFRISRRMREKADELPKELLHQRVQIPEQVLLSQGRHIHNNHHDEENNQHIELIHFKSNFNCINMHLISHLRDHIYKLPNIPVYSTKYRQFAHIEQIKYEW